jgi:hypothetical protein
MAVGAIASRTCATGARMYETGWKTAAIAERTFVTAAKIVGTVVLRDDLRGA